MTTPTGSDRSHESVINDTLARVLRERLGFSAVAESLVNGRRPDIIVRLPQAAPIVLEIEFEPARTVQADALSRLGMEIDGAKVQNAFAVTVPARLRATDQRDLFDRLEASTLQWQEWRSDGTSGPKLSGKVSELGNAVTLATPPSGDLDETVNVLDEGARRAGVILYRAPGTLARVANVFRAPPGDEVAHMARSSSSTPCSSKRDSPVNRIRSRPRRCPYGRGDILEVRPTPNLGRDTGSRLLPDIHHG